MIRILYAINGIVAVLLYLPQIRTILNSKNSAHSFSLLTFGGWCVGALITALYAWTFVHDPMFTAVSLAHMTGAGTVFALVATRRIQARRILLSAGHKADHADRFANNFS